MRPALWPGWWSLDLTGKGERAELRAARRVWCIGHGGEDGSAEEGAGGYVVLVFDLDTATRLSLADGD